MADNLNHSDVNTLCEIVTKSEHLKADEHSSYFTKTKFMNDYSLIFDKQDYDKTSDPRNIKGRFNRQNFESNQKLSTPDSFDTMAKEGKMLWEIPFIWDNFSEDNDSSASGESSEYDSEDEDNDQMLEMIRNLLTPDTSKKVVNQVRKGGGLRFFIA